MALPPAGQRLARLLGQRFHEKLDEHILLRGVVDAFAHEENLIRVVPRKHQRDAHAPGERARRMDEEAPAERAHLPAVRLEQRLLGEQEAVVAAHGLRFLPEDDIGQIQLPGDGLRVLERLRILIVDVDDEAEKPHSVGLLQEIRQIRAVLAAAHHDQALVGPGAAHAVQMGGKAFFQRIPIAPGLFRGRFGAQGAHAVLIERDLVEGIVLEEAFLANVVRIAKHVVPCSAARRSQPDSGGQPRRRAANRAVNG